MITSLFGVIVGCLLTLLVTYYFKERDVLNASLNAAMIIDLTLCEQISTLMNIEKFIDEYLEQETAGKVEFRKWKIIPSVLVISHDMLEKFYLCDAVRFYEKSSQLILNLTIVQRMYEGIFQHLEDHNDSLSSQNLEKMFDENTPAKIKNGLKIEAFSAYESIKYKHHELQSIHKKLKPEFDLFCENVFSERNGFCNLTIKKIWNGNRYKPLIISDKKTKVVDLLDD